MFFEFTFGRLNISQMFKLSISNRFQICYRCQLKRLTIKNISQLSTREIFRHTRISLKTIFQIFKLDERESSE